MNRILCYLILMIAGGSLSAQSADYYKVKSISDTTKVAYYSKHQTPSRLRQAILPLSLIAGGAIIESLPAHSGLGKANIQQYANDHFTGFRTSADNFLQFAPVAAILGLELSGVKGRNDLINQWSIMAKSELLMTAIVFSMKYVIHDTRPDGSADNSMPSGHTAQAFVSATLLDMEYRDTSPWISVAGYMCAVSTGFLRVANNHHWASDVFIGAGIGMASVKLVYLTHRYRWGKKPAGVFIPTLYKNGGGVSFAMKF
jgi:membrane-associated phospholipid phosphatase